MGKQNNKQINKQNRVFSFKIYAETIEGHYVELLLSDIEECSVNKNITATELIESMFDMVDAQLAQFDVEVLKYLSQEEYEQNT